MDLSMGLRFFLEKKNVKFGLELKSKMEIYVVVVWKELIQSRNPVLCSLDLSRKCLLDLLWDWLHVLGEGLGKLQSGEFGKFEGRFFFFFSFFESFYYLSV